MVGSPVTDEQRAKMVALRGLNYGHAEIGAELELDKDTVGKHLRAIEAEAKDHPEPLALLGDVLNDLYEIKIVIEDP